jgi:hypothetical protein
VHGFSARVLDARGNGPEDLEPLVGQLDPGGVGRLLESLEAPCDLGVFDSCDEILPADDSELGIYLNVRAGQRSARALGGGPGELLK